MSPSVLFVHYTPPGVVGGVEHIMHEHSRLLRARGYDVEVAAGRPGEAETEVHVVPELLGARPANQRVEAELDAGVVSPRFYELRRAIAEKLAPLIVRADAVIVHNAYTLHFNLALTSVLWELGELPSTHLIAWCHDLAWTNPLYIPMMHDGYPWDLLRAPAPHVRYVTVSEERRDELRELWGDVDTEVQVVPNGIDPEAFFRLTPSAKAIVDRYGLFDRDAVLLLPVRITRRKNIELAIRAVRCLKDRGLDVRFVVSGPQAPHHPGRSDVYLNRLKALRGELDLEREVVFLADDLGHTLDLTTVSELYQVSDVLLFPSAQEGFGLPILEAGLAHVPVVLSDIRIFREVGGDDVRRFDLEASPDTIAGSIMDALQAGPSRLFRRVLRRYRWDVIVDREIVPLLFPTQRSSEAAGLLTRTQG